MIRATIVTPWTQQLVAETPIMVPLVAVNYALNSWVDITGQPAESITPTPNAFVIEAVMQDAVYVAIEADPAFVVLQSEEAY